MTPSQAIRLINDAEFVVACVAKEAPSPDWEPCESSILNGLTQLDLRYSENGAEFRRFGHL